ncbi:MAG: tRNA epoxyqueuosine(34) reductase QueG [Anaerolineales bacterium]|nr:tRNA epoxyqueuosine(34) reductase QueG [Anaerolineales bacterium]
MIELKQAIQGEARRLGFVLMGVTTPDPPPHYATFEDWLRAGQHAGMAYLADESSRTRRADPRQILPECQSILVLAAPYFPPAQLEAEHGTGRVAAYAWGNDYHEVLPGRLQALVAFIEAQLGSAVPNRWYTDTGPILERDLAQRAGLGWIGKNTCLIHPGLGSYFFLAEILLGIELEPDLPFLSDRCGSCRRCIDACPTGCILPNRTLDAGRCISYLTIELKEQIPQELRSSLGAWVFGCDICQQVCPWNRFALPQGDPDFAPRPELLSLDPAVELSLTTEEFGRRFKRSAVKRSKRRGYLRNVAVVLGNSGLPDAVNVLRAALLNESESLVRAHTAWALGQIANEESRRALDLALKLEKDQLVLAEIQDAIKIG